MARGVRQALGTDFGIAITGIAGPGGGTKAKPVGLVFVAVAGPDRQVQSQRLEIRASREMVRTRATSAAMALLRETLLSRFSRQSRGA